MKLAYKIIAALFCVLLASDYSFAWVRGSGVTSFNNGKIQTNLNFATGGGDWPFTNKLKTANNWDYVDGTGYVAPSDLDDNGYLVPGSDAETNHGGIKSNFRVEPELYVGNNCPNSISWGTCYSLRTTGKGTIYFSTSGGGSISAAIITANAASLTTGSTTTITFTNPQSFKAGMEVPISGTTGVTATNGGGGNITSGGTNGAWTVCAANLTTTQIQLCLADQITALTTSGVAGGTTTVSYGRAAVGVATRGRIVVRLVGSPLSWTVGITSQNASTPITNMEMLLTGSEENRYDTGCYDCIFSSQFLNVLRNGNIGVLRDLNVANSNNNRSSFWSDRKPQTYFSYYSDMYNPVTSSGSGTRIYGGTTTSGNSLDYAVTVGSGAPADKARIIVRYDTLSATISTASPAVVTTTTNHNMTADMPLVFFVPWSGTVPTLSGGGALINTGSTILYYVKTVLSPTTFTIAATKGGAALNGGTSGSGLLLHRLTEPATATSTGGGSPNITWTAHGLSTNDPVGVIALTVLPAELNRYQNYYVNSVVDANTITLKKKGGSAINLAGASVSFTATRMTTMNLNGTGPVPMRSSYFNAFPVDTVGVNDNNQPLAYDRSRYFQQGFMTYDKIMDSWIIFGGNGNGNSYMPSGWPPEIFARLCAAIGAHPWFVSPLFVLDGYTDPATGAGGMTDYMPSLMAMVRDQFQASTAPWMVPRIEPTNETWNSVFYQTNNGLAYGYQYTQIAGWNATDLTNYRENLWYGKIASVLGQSANQVFGGNPGTKYQMVMGTQTVAFLGAGAVGGASYVERFTSSNYINQTQIAQTGYSKASGTAEAYKWATHVSPNLYTSPSYYRTTYETTLANSYNAGSFEGYITAPSTLVVSSVSAGAALAVGTTIYGPGIPSGTTISVSGGGGAGTYTITPSMSTGVSDGSAITMFSKPTGSTATLTEYADSFGSAAVFNGTISGSTLTVNSVTSGKVIGASSSVSGITDTEGTGHVIFYSGGNNVTFISNQTSGTPNGAGTYTLSGSPGNVSNLAMTSGRYDSITSFAFMMANANTLAQTYTNRAGNKLILNSYEGGYDASYSINAPSGVYGTTVPMRYLTKLLTSTPGNATGLTGYFSTNLANYKAAGGEFPSLFQFTGLAPSNNSWSALEDIYQNPKSAYWYGYANYNFLLKRDIAPASNDNDPMYLDKAA